jgi:hypothetical protein
MDEWIKKMSYAYTVELPFSLQKGNPVIFDNIINLENIESIKSGTERQTSHDLT